MPTSRNVEDFDFCLACWANVPHERRLRINQHDCCCKARHITSLSKLQDQLRISGNAATDQVRCLPCIADEINASYCAELEKLHQVFQSNEMCKVSTNGSIGSDLEGAFSVSPCKICSSAAHWLYVHVGLLLKAPCPWGCWLFTLSGLGPEKLWNYDM